MIYVTQFDMFSHYELIIDWLRARKLDTKLADELPVNGFIAKTEKKDAVCAGFLRMVEGGYAMLDSLITNPTQPPEVRDEAIDAVVKRLISAAEDWNITRILANTTDAHTLERSKRHGFTALPNTMIVLEL